MNSVLSIFKWPDLIDKVKPFLEGVFGHFQAQVHYTPNLAQEIKPSRIQRRINVDRVSIDGGWHSCYEQRPGESGQNQLGQERPTLTFNAGSYSQCFSQFDCKTDCFDGGEARYSLDVANPYTCQGTRSRKRQRNNPSSPATTFKAVCGTQTRQVSA